MSLQYEPDSEPLHISVKWRPPLEQVLPATPRGEQVRGSSSSLLLSGLELSDTQVYEP